MTQPSLSKEQQQILVKTFGIMEFIALEKTSTVQELVELAEMALAERRASEEVVVTVLSPKPKAIPLSMELRTAVPAQLTGNILTLEVITQDFDDLHGTDEYHDVEKKQRLYLASFNTKTKRVVFRTGDGKQVVGTAVTPNGNPIKSSESDGIYTDKANGAQWMYVDIRWDGRESKQ